MTGYAEMKAEYERLVEQDHTFADLIEDLAGQVVAARRRRCHQEQIKPRISKPLRPSAAHWKKADGPTPTASGPAQKAHAHGRMAPPPPRVRVAATRSEPRR